MYNEFGVGMTADGERIRILQRASEMTLSQAANLYAWLRLMLEFSDRGKSLAEKAWHDVNE